MTREHARPWRGACRSRQPRGRCRRGWCAPRPPRGVGVLLHERLDLVEVARRGLVHGVSLPVHPEEADPALVVLVGCPSGGGAPGMATETSDAARRRGGESERAGLERRRDERARGQTKSGDDDRPARTVERAWWCPRALARPVESPRPGGRRLSRSVGDCQKIVFSPDGSFDQRRRLLESRRGKRPVVLVVFRRSVDVWRGKLRMAVQDHRNPGTWRAV